MLRISKFISGTKGFNKYHQKPSKKLQNAGQLSGWKTAASRESMIKCDERHDYGNAKKATVIYDFDNKKPDWLDNIRGQRMGYDRLRVPCRSTFLVKS